MSRTSERIAFEPMTKAKNRFNIPNRYWSLDGKGIVESPIKDKRIVSGNILETPKHIPWGGRERIYVNPKIDKEKYEYMINCPLCFDSPYWEAQFPNEAIRESKRAQGSMYRLVDKGRDARKSLAKIAKIQRALALVSKHIGSISMETGELEIIKDTGLEKMKTVFYSLTGRSSEDEYIMYQGIMTKAQGDPDKVIRSVDSESADIAFLFAKLVQNGIITKKGIMYRWHGNNLGNEGAVISKLKAASKQDKAFLDSVKAELVEIEK